MSDDGLLLAGGHIIDPAQAMDRRADLLIRGDRIEAILGPGDPVSSDIERLDVTGQMVTPGFVDIHAHLRYPGQSHKETVASGTASAVRGGFTTVCAMANTTPAVDSGLLVEEVGRRLREEARCHVRTFGAVTKGLQGAARTDARELLSAGSVALSDDGNPVVSADVMTDTLAASCRLGFVVSAHEELRQPGSMGAVDPRWECTGEVELIRRDLDLVRKTGGRLHIAHVSCAQSLELIAAAKAEGLAVTAEATPHHLTLDESIWDGLDMSHDLPANHGYAKVNPPVRSSHDRAEVVAALQAGVIDAIATDHAPHSRSEKCGSPAVAAFGFTAFEFALPLLLQLVDTGAMTLYDVIERLTSGPARALALPAGSLKPGATADVCVFDPVQSWMPERDTVVSKGKNHPLMLNQMSGRVQATVVAGRVHRFGQDHGLRALRVI